VIVVVRILDYDNDNDSDSEQRLPSRFFGCGFPGQSRSNIRSHGEVPSPADRCPIRQSEVLLRPKAPDT